MKEVSASNFGLLIANLIPGFTALWGVSYFSETVRVWLGGSSLFAPTVGGFLYVTIASVAAGMTVSSVRWLLVDTIHGWTGIRQPSWDFSRLQDNITAYKTLIQIHYEFYLHYSNMVIAVSFVYVARRLSLGFFSTPLGWIDLGFLLVGVAYFVTSRDNLSKYHTRVAKMLGTEAPSASAIGDEYPPDTEKLPLNSELPMRRLDVASEQRARPFPQTSRKEIPRDQKAALELP